MAGSEEQTQKSPEPAIIKLAVSGYKSLAEECSIELKPLTVLAGANSSGKSSIIQPLLLLKQTLDANYDPGALRLDGPNVRFSSGEQLLSKCGPEKSKSIEFKFWIGDDKVHVRYHWQKQKGFEIVEQNSENKDESLSLSPGMNTDGLQPTLPDIVRAYLEDFESKKNGESKLKVIRNRCFLELQFQSQDDHILFGMAPAGWVATAVKTMIYLPGLRGNPERNYPVTAVGAIFTGTFHEYTASVLVKLQNDGEKTKLQQISKDLERLGLTWKIEAVPVNDTQVELRVARLPHPADDADMVSIADVGLGVSQTLPVIVALHIARAGQIVFIEEPEIHLHPSAQMTLAEILAEAANRGVVVIVETHSSILLRGIQTAVALQKITGDKVSLNWFKRDMQSGQTECIAGTLDETGAFGDWPEDFDEITLESEKRFLDATEAVHH